MSDETLVEHLEQIIDDCVSPKVAAHASLLVVADAVEGEVAADTRAWVVIDFLREQAAEEGAENGDD